MKSINVLFRLLFVVSMLITMLPGNVAAQKLKPGPQDLSFFSTVDDTDQPYAVYIPENFDESKAYPLVVFLHGAWSNHRLGLRRLFGVGNSQGYDFIKPGNIPYETDVEASRYWPKFRSVEFVAAAPYARGTAGYQGIPEQDVYDMLADLKSRFRIDENRIYLTGLSMGGGGTLWLGLTRPDIWAAIAPVCPAPPEGTDELAGNAGNLPVHLFIGDKDFLYKTATEWKGRLEATARQFDYVEYPGVGHNSWEWAYKDGFIFDWFSQFTRDPFPRRVRYSTGWFKYDKAYWVTFDNFIPGNMASIDASFSGSNSIEVSTSGVDAFTLNLSGHPMFSPDKKVSVKVDGKSFTCKTPDALSFSKSGAVWSNTRFTPGLTSKQRGSEGPMYAAVSGSHIYVYGTGGNPSKEELAERRAQAVTASEWNGLDGRIMVHPRVIADKDVRSSDYVSSNLVLFGTRETNMIIEKFADNLPVHLNSGEATGYGLVYVFPLSRHYVIVNSGLSWWTKPLNTTGQEGMVFSGNVVEALKKYQDFILFKEAPDNVIVQGRFDNDWKLPEEAVAIFKSSGIVTVK